MHLRPSILSSLERVRPTFGSTVCRTFVPHFGPDPWEDRGFAAIFWEVVPLTGFEHVTPSLRMICSTRRIQIGWNWPICGRLLAPTISSLARLAGMGCATAGTVGSHPLGLCRRRAKARGASNSYHCNCVILLISLALSLFAVTGHFGGCNAANGVARPPR